MQKYEMYFSQDEAGLIGFFVELEGSDDDPVFSAQSSSMVDLRSPNLESLTEHIVGGLNDVLRQHGLLKKF